MTDIPVIEETISRPYVFNQYYWDFIKKVKDIAKAKRDADGEAKHIHKTIKQHYAVFDKMAESHYADFQAAHAGTWKAYLEAPVESLPGFFETEPHSGVVLFKGDLTLGQVYRCFAGAERVLVHQYYTLFGILSDPTTDIQALLGLMKQFKLNAELKGKLDALPDDCGIKVPLVRLYSVHGVLSGIAGNPFLEEIENTSLGKLAKEIMGDINLDDLSPDMLSGGSGGLMEMLMGGAGGAAGGGGLAKIISTVSQKMVSKMSSGELNQEDLLKDALGVAAKLPAMMPGGMGADLSKMGDLLSMLSGAGGAGGSQGKKSGSRKNSATAPGGFDLSALMGMMGGLGGLGGAGGGMPNLTKKQMEKASRDGRVKSKLSSEMKRQKLAERLRKKVDARNAPAATDPDAPSSSSSA